MGNEKVLMKSEERKSLAEVATFLRSLAAALNRTRWFSTRVRTRFWH